MTIEIHARLLDTMGTDASIARYARLCTGRYDPDHGEVIETEGDRQTVVLSNARTLVGLIRRGHTSPFEFADSIWLLRVPIYVMRQVVRHRTASILERSLRYCYPPADGLTDDVLDRYRALIDGGAAPEDARAILPLSTQTEAVWKIDLKNLLHFLRLRQAPDAQSQTRQLADQIAAAVAEWVPLTWAAWTEASDAERGRF